MSSTGRPRSSRTSANIALCPASTNSSCGTPGSGSVSSGSTAIIAWRNNYRSNTPPYTSWRHIFPYGAR
ncbi:hypothetical protein GCM10010430_58560 [Kitasatospora cystarginea]|uniref:Uncharacterized protein n=1 Tax=Kitasatospora cystarginea TaxID=58350 RepID=A0ABP5RL58_9ACTN